MAKLRYIIFVIIFIAFMIPLLSVSADSGWDSDYSSGSSWGGGSSWSSSSDWGGSSDWDYSRSSDSSSHSSGNLKFEIIYVLVILSVLITGRILSMIMSMPISTGKVKRRAPTMSLEENSFVHDYDEIVKKYIPQYTEKELIEHLFKLFIDIQTAWMNFDYDTLKRLCTDQLYQSYKMDLEQLKENHQQNIMYNFSLSAANIMEIIEENGTIIIKLFMHAVFVDYVIDTDTEKIVRGNDKSVVHNQYNLEFVVTKNLLEKCPNCGKELNGKNECEYCHSHINDNYSDFVLSKKDKFST